MADISNGANTYTSKSRETVPLRKNKFWIHNADFSNTGNYSIVPYILSSYNYPKLKL
jgi:hypothetical protein